MTRPALTFTPRAAIYAHTETKRDDIQKQIKSCEAFARKQGWHVAGVYSDANNRNFLINRPELIRLVQDAAEGDFDVVLCQCIDRITLNLGLQRDMLVRLYETGLETWSVEEGPLEELRLYYQRDLPPPDEPLGPFRRRDDKT